MPSSEEMALWKQVSQGVQQLKKAPIDQTFKGARPSLESRLDAIEAPPSPLPKRPQGSFAPVIAHNELDRPTLRHFRRGSITPVARLDLHGVRQEKAYERLLRFVAEASARGGGWALVITGKGSDEKPSVLRAEVPQWLQRMPEYVVSFAPALPEEGGEGALYVHLRKPR